MVLNTFAFLLGVKNLSEEEILDSFREERIVYEEGLKDHLLKLLGYYGRLLELLSEF